MNSITVKKMGRSLLGMSFAVIVAVVLLGVLSVHTGRKAAEQNAITQTQNLAASINQHISSTFREIDNVLLSTKHEMEKDLLLGKLNLSRIERSIDFQQILHPEIIAIRVTNSEGRIILNKISDDPSLNISDRFFFTYLRDHPEAGVFITKPIVGKVTGKWVIISVRRYNFPDGRFAGVVAAPVLIEHFQKVLSKFNVGVSGILTLRDDEGGVVTRYPPVVKGKTLPIGDRMLSREFMALIHSGISSKTYSALTPFDNTWRMLTLQRIEAAPFYIVASLAEEDYLAPWKKDRAITLTLILIFLIAGLIITRLLWVSWRRRERDANALRENSERLQSILQTSMDGFCMIDLQGRLLEVNETYCKMSGYSEQELLTMSISDLDVVESTRETAEHMQQVREKGQDRFETRHKRKGGNIFEVEISVKYWPYEGGRMICFLRDITGTKKVSLALQESEYFFKESQRAASIGSYKTDFIKGAWESSEVLDQIFGIDQRYSRSVQGWLDIVHPDDRAMMGEYLQEEVILKRRPFDKEYRIIRKSDGAVRWVRGLGRIDFDINGNVTSMIGTILDVTQRKQTEENQLKIERQFRLIFENASDGILIADVSSKQFFMGNKKILKMLGYDLGEVQNLTVNDIHPKEDLPTVLAAFEEQQKQLRTLAENLPVKRKDGSIFFADIDSFPLVLDGKQMLIGFFRDITARKQAEEKITQSLKEKEILLREIHHRVKNNMAVISSLMSLQVVQIQEPTLKTLFQETHQRVKSMGLIHEKLYQAKDFTGIDFEGYIRTLISEIMNVYRIDIRNITTEICIEDIKLDLQSAMPCGLIINELLTNVFKHAFPDKRKGFLKIYFTRLDNNYTLLIKDDGIGLPRDQDQVGKTLGLQLVNALAGQLKGTFQFKGEQGVEAIVIFKNEKG